jgi:thioredoxin reductase
MALKTGSEGSASKSYDVVIVGGGPAGLAAALTLGRARKRVLLCDAGARRNAAAEHVHGFVTRDGITPADFRRIGLQQLESYPNVEAREAHVEEIHGSRGDFTLRIAAADVTARRVLLCTGMVDELPDVDGLRALWGRSVFQCPYCHGWEVQDRRFGFLALSVDSLEFALFLRGWTGHVAVLTNGRYAVPSDTQARLTGAGIHVEALPITRLVARDEHLESVELADGSSLDLDVLFCRPPQRQVAVVQALGLALDASSYIEVNDHRQTSIPGVYAAGDLATPAQSATLAAASGALAASMLNHDLTMEMATSGLLV